MKEVVLGLLGLGNIGGGVWDLIRTYGGEVKTRTGVTLRVKKALVTGTAKLPRFELNRPENVIGRTTLSNLQSGMYYGYVGLVRNIVRKIRQELGEEALVVATGGMALMIAEESKVIDKLDGLLTLKGLRLIYERNQPEGGKRP